MIFRLLGVTFSLCLIVLPAGGQQPPTTQSPQSQNPQEAKSQDTSSEDAVDPYAELKKRVDALYKLWGEAKRDADENIPKYAKDNPCSRKIKPAIDKEREAFEAYMTAEDLYVQKQAADILEDVTRSSKIKADNQSTSVDYQARIASVEGDLKDEKAKAASLPPDDPFYKDIREQIAMTITVNVESLRLAKDAQARSASSARSLQANADYLNYRKRYAESMQLQDIDMKIDMAAQYDDETAQWLERCSKSKTIKR